MDDGDGGGGVDLPAILWLPKGISGKGGSREEAGGLGAKGDFWGEGAKGVAGNNETSSRYTLYLQSMQRYAKLHAILVVCGEQVFIVKQWFECSRCMPLDGFRRRKLMPGSKNVMAGRREEFWRNVYQ